jgi:hypothetical protein
MKSCGGLSTRFRTYERVRRAAIAKRLRDSILPYGASSRSLYYARLGKRMMSHCGTRGEPGGTALHAAPRCAPHLQILAEMS